MVIGFGDFKVGMTTLSAYKREVMKHFPDLTPLIRINLESTEHTTHPKSGMEVH